MNAARCCGADVDFSDEQIAEWIEKMMPHKEALTEFERETLALASLMSGRTVLVIAFLDDEPGERFCPRPRLRAERSRHDSLSPCAQKHRAEARDIEPAWRDFLQAFPRRLAAKTLTWPDLAWAARAYYCEFFGAESSQVLPSLYNEVQELMQ